MLVRPWRPDADLARLVEVSQAADRLVAEFGLDLPPDDPTDELIRAEHMLVADGPPIAGFAVVNTVDGLAHLASLGVHPDFGRRGIGSELLTAACAVTTRPAITLTTFSWPCRGTRPGTRHEASRSCHRASGVRDCVRWWPPSTRPASRWHPGRR